MRRLLPLLLLVAAVAVAPAATAEERVLDQPRHGADAVRALGDRIAAVARANDTTGAKLREELQHDLSLWVDVQGRLFYVDPPAPADVEATEVATTSTTSPQTAAEALSLQSKPGAQRTIHLDFDGVGGIYGDSIGSAWSRSYTGGDGVAEPYDRDGNIDSFGTGEIAEIFSIWQRVAEDFAPFDVNVTTQELGFDTINRSNSADMVFGTRVALTSSETRCGCGGVAYVGVFDLDDGNHAAYQPAFVYNEGAKAAAEAASHEAGHNLGLSHDGTASVGYYEGHGAWAPIMGVGYYEPISQWSRGEYSGANNPEDDFSVAEANGAAPRTDEPSQPLTATSSGVISTGTDADEYTFVLEAATDVVLQVDPAPSSPNLDVAATLWDSSGRVVAAQDVPSAEATFDTATGLGATLGLPLPAGTYTLRIDGVGAGDAATTGYSDYGSVGAYSISSTGITFPEAPPPDDDGTQTEQPPAAPTNVRAAASGSAVTVSWTDVANETSYLLSRQKKVRGGWSSTTSITLLADVTGHSEALSAGTYRYEISAVNSVGSAAATSNEVVVGKSTGKTK